jgi:hypothetical protein
MDGYREVFLLLNEEESEKRRRWWESSSYIQASDEFPSR